MLFLFLVVIIESAILVYAVLNIYIPVQKLWDAIKDIDFTSNSIDFSKLDQLQPTKFGTSNKLILRYKSLADIICERITMINEVTTISESDGLTGCYNVQRLNNYKFNYQQANNFIIIFIDVNNLKRMNDTLGHEAGDKLIKDAAKHIKFWDTYGDTYRIGGDEFMVVLTNIDSQQAGHFIQQWHRSVGVLAETQEGFKCMLSIGVAEGKYGDNFDIVQKVADERMYNFKVNLKKQLGEPMR